MRRSLLVNGDFWFRALAIPFSPRTWLPSALLMSRLPWALCLLRFLYVNRCCRLPAASPVNNILAAHRQKTQSPGTRSRLQSAADSFPAMRPRLRAEARAGHQSFPAFATVCASERPVFSQLQLRLASLHSCRPCWPTTIPLGVMRSLVRTVQGCTVPIV